MKTTDTLENVKEYYGQILSSSGDLKTSVCCSTESMPDYHREIIKEINNEILDRFYGCGSPIPPAMEKRQVLDLGCGTGRDVYLASRLVGEEGYVIGIDMTDEQLELARKHIETQTHRFGYKKPNIEFRKGYIEYLRDAGIEDDSIDLVISNCVINLSPDKPQVLSEIFRVLKNGGEFYFSDVFADRRIPADLAGNPVAYGECLSGALYLEDFRRIMRDIGIFDYRIITRNPIDLQNSNLKRMVGNINFESITIRAFKLDTLEDLCEDYGQIAVYRGTIPEMPHKFILDDHHTFETGKPMTVCGNTVAMLEKTHYGKYFKISGDRSIHYGAFDCGSEHNPGREKALLTDSCC